MALPATDTFTTGPSADLENYGAGNWTLNSGGAGAMRIVNTVDAVHSVNVDENLYHWNADTFANDQYSEATASGAAGSNSFIGPAVRVHASAATGYYYYVSSDSAYLSKLVSGSWTQLGSTGSAGGNNLRRLEAEGTTITPYAAGSVDSSIGAQTDSSIASGSAGLSGYAEDAGHRLDNWEGGNLGSGPVARRIFVTHC